MTTYVTDIISQALRDIGVIGDGQTASAEQMNSAFATFQQMIASWQAEKLNVYAQVETSFTPTAALTYTVGTGGVVNITRPVDIDYAIYSLSGVDYQVQVIETFEEYERIVIKTIPGSIPCALYYQPSYPLGVIYLYPQATVGSVKIITRIQFPAYATIADDLALPPEYAMPVRYSLAELLSAENQTPLRPDVAMLAKKYRTIMKRNNAKVPTLRLPEAVLCQNGFIDYRVG